MTSHPAKPDDSSAVTAAPQPRLLPPIREIMAIETRRSLLPKSRGIDPAAWRDGFEYFARAYGPAMRQFVGALLRGRVRRSRTDDMPDEIVQSYLAECMARDWLFPATGEIESFRVYVKTQLRRFVINYLDHFFAGVRDPRRAESLGADDPASPKALDPADAAFDRSLVDIALNRALDRLRESSPADAMVIDDLLQTDLRGSDDILERIGRVEGRVRDIRRRARTQFAKLFREQLETMTSRHDDEEIERLLRELDRFIP